MPIFISNGLASRQGAVAFEGRDNVKVQGERKGRRLGNYVPLWMVAVATVSLLVIVNTFVSIMLSGAVRAAVSKISSLTAG